MTSHSFVNGHIVTPRGVLSDAMVDVEGGIIVAIVDRAGPGAIDLDGGWLMPGFIDTQVNGGGGVLFNDALSVEGIAAIGDAHRPFGTTAFLPTLISDTHEAIAQALDATDAAIAAGVPGVLGAHIEGPVINIARKGIHDPRHFGALDDALMALLLKPRRGQVMVTLAPELAPADRIAALARAGVLVSLGHSDATYAEATAGFAAGVTGVTHLFNAMSPLVHRAPGVVGAALDDSYVYCGLIVDGFHVDDAVLRIALRARPADRMMLVSDAMPCVNAATKSFVLQGREIHVEGGRCVGADGTLAGSDLDMAAAVRNTVDRLGVPAERAAAMAATNPAAFLGLSRERGTIATGRRADWVQLDAGLHAVTTVIAGEIAAHAPPPLVSA
ncbi:N-acetylglucosamine-6-phosphate deacetylase [Sphingomonas sp. AAP5]|uniref:N-acetylglucosamine-6-phosphate deacetylase n=1 Tax=Sphingomonas sp. AAP5 TaxID=1523415 RepID=UPI0010571DBA|nr:N-acetylglucosamine-6-phosphate deacetylase [Sphingomonas sp. AAP5]QBM76016.1 N-acetylglucosamine-6-phosphate deacetylase [Sphingomonas sp. AAP5]